MGDEYSMNYITKIVLNFPDVRIYCHKTKQKQIVCVQATDELTDIYVHCVAILHFIICTFTPLTNYFFG